MQCPLTAAAIKKSYGDKMVPRWIVTLDEDAADIMGETKMRYVFDSENGAIHFCETLQANLQSAWEDAQ